ncbi:MAG: hypothetical protein ACRBN8_39745 [Nannocystales bacterium]
MSWLLTFVVPAALGGLGYRAFRSRVRGGRFTVHDGGGVSMIETELGKYTFDRGAGKIHLERPGGVRAFVRLRDVRGVQVRVGLKEAGLEEAFFEGWNLTDLMAEYRDHRIYWDVVINTSHGAVPLAHMSQYKKRDWFDLATPAQHAVLSWVGLYRDGALVAASLEGAIRRSLRAAGLNVIGGYGEAAPTGALRGTPIPTDADLPKPAPAPRERPLAIDLPPPPDNPRWESASKGR